LKQDGAVVISAVWLGRQKTYRVILAAASVFLALLILVPGIFLFVQDAEAHGKFPQNVKVCGVDVGLLTAKQALDKVHKELAGMAAQPFQLKVDDEVLQAAPGDIGLELQYNKMIVDAYGAAWNMNPTERMMRRFLGRPKAIRTGVSLTCDQAKLDAFLQRALGSINQQPHDAYIDVSTGVGHIVKAKDGRTMTLGELKAQATKALADGKWQVPVVVAKRTPAKDDGAAIVRYILVNVGDHTLSLYNRDTLVAKWPVATGSKEWPTCIGEWAVTRVEKNPTWYNRGSTWAENMPASLPPGPNNPLGTRAITINGGGVLIHGTSDTGSIGYSASHGCVRMRIPDVEALYPQVNVGMPVYIIRASGSPGFDCSKKPFWK